MKRRILTLIVLLTAFTSCGQAQDSPEIPVEQPTSITQTSTSTTAPTVTASAQTKAAASTPETTASAASVTAAEATAKTTRSASDVTAAAAAAEGTYSIKTTSNAGKTTEAVQTASAPQTTAATSAADKPTEPKQPDVKAFEHFSDYTDWAGSIGYPGGLLFADGSSGLNQDYFRTPDNAESYSSGRIVIGDSRCCQLGIYQDRTGRNDYAAFAVWGGHYVSGYGGIMTDQHFTDVEKCFQKQIQSCGKCTIFFFATVNDYDCWNNNNSAYISSAVNTAERLSSLRYEMNGRQYCPDIVVIGFDGCWTTSDLYGTPHETFNRFVSAYNDSLRAAVYASPTLQNSISGFSTVPDIAGGKADFIDDGLHYSDTTLEDLSSFIISFGG
jgi:hypothetical protein